MSNGSPSAHRPTNGERRAAARDKARQLRTDQKKRDRRNRVLIQTGIGVAILAVLAIVVVVIGTSIRPPQPGPANMASDGILIGKGLKAVPTGSVQPGETPIANKPDKSGQTVDIVTYVDYLCPYCGQFERTNSDQIGKLVSSGAATIEIHPIPLLTNRSAGTKYSLRAANAAGCVADYSPNAFWKFNTSLFANQPEEGSAGLTDTELKAAVSKAGASRTSSIAKCIDDQRYSSWAQDALARALSGPIPNADVKKLSGTPLVLVNGQQYKGSLTSADEFRAFIVQAQGESYATASPTATPTPTPTSAPTP